MTASVPVATSFFYTGDGATTAFSFPLRFLENADVQVFVDGVLKTLTTHYTLSGAGGPSGGTVTFVSAPAGAPAPATIELRRNTLAKQTVDLSDSGRTPGDTLEMQLDRLAMAGQDQSERVDAIEELAADFEAGIAEAEAAAAAASTSAAAAIIAEGNAATAEANAEAAQAAAEAAAASAANKQPLDDDLTAIAALTTTAYGRSLLESVSAALLFAAIKQSGTTSSSGAVQLGNEVRERLTADRTLFIRPNGNDANDGSADDAAHAFLTRQAAWNYACKRFDLAGYKLKFKLADGTYTGALRANIMPLGATTPEDIIWEGNTTTPANVLISTTSAHAFEAGDTQGQYSAAMFTVRKMKLQTTTAGDCILALGSASVFVDDVNFGACAGSHMNALHHSWIFCKGNYTISGSASNGHFAAASGGTVVGHDRTVTFAASVSFYAFVSVSAHGRVYANNMTFTYGGFSVTGLRYAVSEQGMIYTNYAGENYLPGSTPGLVATGGRYDGMSLEPGRVNKTGDESRATTTALANDTHLKFSMQANVKYAGRIVVKFDAPATPGFKWGISGPSSPGWSRFDKRWRAPAGTSFTSEAADVGTTYPTAKTIAGNASTSGFLEIEFRVDNGPNAGIFAFQWAQNTSDASNTTVGIASYLEYWIVR